MSKFIIQDWAGNDCFKGKTFESWDDGEDYLCIFLDNKYESDRSEYYIIEVES